MWIPREWQDQQLKTIDQVYILYGGRGRGWEHVGYRWVGVAINSGGVGKTTSGMGVVTGMCILHRFMLRLKWSRRKRRK